MKRSALVLILVLLTATAFGQGTGRMMISGGTNGWLSADLFVDESDQAWTTVDLYGWAGYFFIQSLEIGPYLSFELERWVIKDIDYRYSYRNMYIGLQFAYFILPDSRVSPFIQALVAYRMAAESEKDSGITIYEYDWSALMIQDRFGIEIMMTDSVAFSVGAYYQYYTNLETNYSAHEMGGFFGFDVFLGPF